jgi:hypothetical protein
VRKLFLPGILVGTATVLVAVGNGRVVVPGDSSDPPCCNCPNYGVGPGAIPHQVAQVVNQVDSERLYVGEDRLQGGEVTVYVGYESYPHWK